jgi:hypothetical protein
MLRNSHFVFNVWRLAFAFALASLAWGTAEAQSGPQGPVTYQQIVSSGDPARRINIAVVGDGYTAGELSTYQALVNTLMSVSDPNAGFFSQQPFKEYKRYFNVYRIDAASLQSGADIPTHTDCFGTAWPGKSVDTAFSCHYNFVIACPTPGRNDYRGLTGNSAVVNSVVAAALPGVSIDFTICLVNETYYGGTGGGVMFMNAKGRSAADITNTMLHEAGHTIASLADEYYQGVPCNVPTVEPAQQNITIQTNRSAIKWNYWIASTTACPILLLDQASYTDTPQIPSAWEGARGCLHGIYRPTKRSKMFDSNAQFGQIDTEQLVLNYYERVSPIDTSTPASSTFSMSAGVTQAFNVTPLLPLTHSLNATWYVNGVQMSTGYLFYWTPTAGTYTVQVVVGDPTTWVRPDFAPLTSGSRTWNVTVTTPVPKITSISPTSGNRGTSVGLTINGFNLSSGVVQFTPSSGITVTNTSYLPGQIFCTVTIAPSAAPGIRTVKVTTPGGTSNTKNFTVN